MHKHIRGVMEKWLKNKYVWIGGGFLVILVVGILLLTGNSQSNTDTTKDISIDKIDESISKANKTENRDEAIENFVDAAEASEGEESAAYYESAAENSMLQSEFALAKEYFTTAQTLFSEAGNQDAVDRIAKRLEIVEQQLTAEELYEEATAD